jgi:hypothetical protein
MGRKRKNTINCKSDVLSDFFYFITFEVSKSLYKNIWSIVKAQYAFAVLLHN